MKLSPYPLLLTWPISFGYFNDRLIQQCLNRTDWKHPASIGNTQVLQSPTWHASFSSHFFLSWALSHPSIHGTMSSMMTPLTSCLDQTTERCLDAAMLESHRGILIFSWGPPSSAIWSRLTRCCSQGTCVPFLLLLQTGYLRFCF